MDLTLILVAAVPSIITAMATIIIGTKLGVGPLNAEVRDQRAALVATLKDRVSSLEKENAALKQENEDLKRRVDRLEERLLDLALDRREQ